jgi:hypothetical protein
MGVRFIGCRDSSERNDLLVEGLLDWNFVGTGLLSGHKFRRILAKCSFDLLAFCLKKSNN